MDCGIINWLLKFADDTKLFGKVQSELDNKSLQGDLQRSFDWAKEWQMEFNIDKCKVMHIGNSNKNFKYYSIWTTKSWRRRKKRRTLGC